MAAINRSVRRQAARWRFTTQNAKTTPGIQKQQVRRMLNSN
jgi:hypothetical protein